MSYVKPQGLKLRDVSIVDMNDYSEVWQGGHHFLKTGPEKNVQVSLICVMLTFWQFWR